MPVTKARKKPVEIEAFQFTDITDWNELNEWANEDVKELEPKNIFRVATTLFKCHTLEGDLFISFGDWIIKGVNGEFYPCKPDIFEKTYEVL